MTCQPMVRLDDCTPGGPGRSYRFSGLVEEISAVHPADLRPALARIEAAVGAGLHAAGCLAYEAATALDPALPVKPRPGFPLLWFGIFRERQIIEAPPLPPPSPAGSYRLTGWRNSLSRAAYTAAVARIRAYIASGDTYQVNFTMRRRFRFEGDPLAWYADLCRAQQASFCAYLAFARWRVLSASPELFFSLRDRQLTVRPMKGTAPRGRWPAEDRALATALAASPKERAENLMIVDLLRSDLGIVAETGSVQVASLFDVEPLPTVQQMTSTVTARLRQGTGLAELLSALFPCGSVTGAPKRRTMAIIRELERGPRGLYTGCIGYVSPGQEAMFSVAIRTAVIDLASGRGSLGLGSGITWDAEPAAEYAECLAKGRFATTRLPEFQLVETLLATPREGYFLLERHLARLAASAAYFGFRHEPAAIAAVLDHALAGLASPHRIRLLLDRDGTVTPESAAIDVTGSQPVPVRLATSRTDSRKPFLFHKTTHRPLYQAALAGQPDCGELLFLNERNELTEGTISNVVVRLAGELVTPPLACGLLPGVFRAELLDRGVIRERVITATELRQAEGIWLINSVRRWRRARLLTSNLCNRQDAKGAKNPESK
jgi:para-aminobenzoate synthetase/4-amino-4-deoxychorismate lyase